jgi:hypothetical protein
VFFAPPDFGKVIAFERKVKLVGVGAHEAGEGNRQIEAHCHVPAAVVFEAVDLLIGLSAALAQQHFGVFKHRRIDGHEAELPAAVLNGPDNAPPEHFFFRENVPEAF